MHHHKGQARARPQQRDQPEVQKEYCAVEFISVIEASKNVAIKVESILDAISMISGASIDRCVRILLTTFYHMHH